MLIGHADAATGEGARQRPRRAVRQHLRAPAERIRTKSELKGALERAELELVFQPIVSLTDGETAAHEALLRWRRVGVRWGPRSSLPSPRSPPDHPDRLVGARERLPRRREARGRDRRLDLGEPAGGQGGAQPDLLSVVAGALRAGNLKPGALSLELTETVLLGVTPAIVTNLERLHELGVRIVLDDFGTGYWWLKRLKDFPIDAIKIDRSFVANLGRSSQDAAIVAPVRRLDGLGAGLAGLLVAEGVEKRDAGVAAP